MEHLEWPMPRLEWNKVLDRYLIDNTMHQEEYEQLDDYQKFTIQELKKSFKRLTKKTND